jgi:hemin uptake protein HemP
MQEDANPRNSRQNKPPEPAKPPQAKPARIASRDLLQGRSELIIEHQNREYRLRLTQSGKLILTA